MGGSIRGIGNNSPTPEVKAPLLINSNSNQVNQAVQGQEQEITTNNQGGQKITEQTMSQVLEQLSLPNTPENQKLAKALLQYNLPLNKETLQELGRLLKQLAGSSDENISLLAFLKSKNIPLDKELIRTIKSFLGEKNLANLLSKLPQLLSEEEGLTQLTQLLSKLSPQGKEELVKLLRNLGEGKNFESNKTESTETGQDNQSVRGNPTQLAQQLEETTKGSEKNLQQLTKTLEQMPKELVQKLQAHLEKSESNNSLSEKGKLLLAKVIQQLESLKDNPGQISKDLAKNLAQLPKNVAEELQKQMESLKNSSSQPQEEKEILVKLSQQMGKAGKEAEEVLKQLANKLKDLPKEVVQRLLANLSKTTESESMGTLDKQILKTFFAQEKFSPNLWQKIEGKLEKILQEGQLPKEAKDFVKLLKGLIIDAKQLQSEELTQVLKNLMENKKEFLHGKNLFLGDDSSTPEKEALTKLWADLKGSLETENLLKYWQIPVLIQGKIYQAGLKIDQEDREKKEGDQEGDRLVIFLQTENLGQIKIDLTAKEQDLTFRFGVEDEEIKESVETSLSDLEEKLKPLGYQIKEASCSIDLEKPEENYLELEKRIVFSTLKRIDLLT